MDAYLRYNPFGVRLSAGAIDMIKVLLSLEGLVELSFLELLRELMILFTPNIRFYEKFNAFINHAFNFFIRSISKFNPF